MYSHISVTTKHGKFEHEKCDYYIQNNMLTVFRKEKIAMPYDAVIYRPYESHYPMENVVEIECIKA